MPPRKCNQLGNVLVQILVATTPGCRQFTVTLVLSKRHAKAYVKRTFASFDCEYARRRPYFRLPCKSSKSIKLLKCASELTLTMRAGALALRVSSKRLVSKK